eukprot:scaffold17703_cov119-Isochrysis_galbana.AAC.6
MAKHGSRHRPSAPMHRRPANVSGKPSGNAGGKRALFCGKSQTPRSEKRPSVAVLLRTSEEAAAEATPSPKVWAIRQHKHGWAVPRSVMACIATMFRGVVRDSARIVATIASKRTSGGTQGLRQRTSGRNVRAKRQRPTGAAQAERHRVRTQRAAGQHETGPRAKKASALTCAASSSGK